MTKKELQAYYWTMRNIEQLEQKLAELEAEVTRQTSRITHTPRGKSNKSMIEALVIKIIEVQEEINRQLKRSYELVKKIERAIEPLPPREACLIRARYLDLKTWDQIAADMNYSWRQIHYIHRNALRLLSQDCTPLHMSM